MYSCGHFASALGGTHLYSGGKRAMEMSMSDVSPAFTMLKRQETLKNMIETLHLNM